MALSSKSMPYTRLLAQKFPASFHIIDILPAHCLVAWDRDFDGIKLKVDGSALGNPGSMGGGGAAHNNLERFYLDFQSYLVKEPISKQKQKLFHAESIFAYHIRSFMP
ncbi:hypothetical protein ACH5RR_023370 [Cinchona calisaya]|uniref:Uncharacterized protein n=1 Tax=Cinchona calisaya TaxID=153742 RepID=A0ABD2ZFH4_9GENT